ncbi:hypothetical protein, partial [Mediterranea massiliensis]|uniref:hypothetical protein n=1 Tax=Mediterranea massiliensis TaxID=1841865 RepID=UPI0025A455DE
YHLLFTCLNYIPALSPLRLFFIQWHLETMKAQRRNEEEWSAEQIRGRYPTITHESTPTEQELSGKIKVYIANKQ